MFLTNLLLDLLYPKFCVGCHCYGSYLCADCHQKISFFTQPLCPGCMKPTAKVEVHEECVKKTALQGLYVLGKHTGILRTLITDMKYKGYADYAKLLGDMLVWHFSKCLQKENKTLSPETLVVPVPMFWRKEWERGYNQSSRIAKGVSKQLQITFSPQLLVKKTATAAQASLSKKERQTIQKDLYICPIPTLSNLPILLIDDVLTTGSTLQSAALALKRAHAGSIIGLVLSHGS